MHKNPICCKLLAQETNLWSLVTRSKFCFISPSTVRHDWLFKCLPDNCWSQHGPKTVILKMSDQFEAWLPRASSASSLWYLTLDTSRTDIHWPINSAQSHTNKCKLLHGTPGVLWKINPSIQDPPLTGLTYKTNKHSYSHSHPVNLTGMSLDWGRTPEYPGNWPPQGKNARQKKWGCEVCLL